MRGFLPPLSFCLQGYVRIRSGMNDMTLRIIFALTALPFIAACAPQAELVKTRSELAELREDSKTSKARVLEMQKKIDQDFQKRLDLIEANVKGLVDIQKVIADNGARFDQLTTDLQLLQGKLEENNFRIAELAQKLDDKSFQIAQLAARMDELEAKVKSLPTGSSGVSTAPSVTFADKGKKPGPKPVEPSEAYRQAMSDYNSGNFDLALAGFQNYITQFPEASQVDSALYWVGECYYSLKEYERAREAFTKVIKNHPKSDKVAGAKLKIGFSYLNEKNTAKAKDYLRKVVKEHPSTKEAELAKEKLHKLGK